MKLREQFTLDTIIKERAASLARPDLQANAPELLRRAKVLVVLAKCQEEITEIMAPEVEQVPSNVDVNINLPPSDTAPNKAFQPFDAGDVSRSIAKKLEEQIRERSLRERKLTV